MLNRTALLLSLVVAPAVFAEDAKPPPAPTFEGWTVKSDGVIEKNTMNSIAKKLGVKLLTLRNTQYDVKGEKTQVNVMTVADAAAADKLVTALTKKKEPWSVVKKDTTVYEFVGGPKATDALKAASATLSK